MENIENIKIWLNNNIKGDRYIWMIITAFGIISILVVYSATGTLAYKRMSGNVEYYLMKHSLLVILGILAMWLAHKIDYRYFAGLSKLALWISVPLLIYTWQFGTTLNEASRWITIPVINQAFQPSDLAKLALIASLAHMLSKKQQKIQEFKQAFIPMLGWCGAICGLIALSDFSTALLLFVTCLLLMFIGRVPIKYLLMLCMTGLLAGTIALAAGQRLNTAVNRVKHFVSSFTNPDEVPFQAKQSYIAIASGGVIGKGPGQSDQRNFLPHPYSDFIFAIILEEYGLMGGLVVLFLYLMLLYRGMRTATYSDKAFGGLLAAGLSFAIVLQALVNMGVAVGLGPITGLPLPFLSMGGTSLLFMGVAIGIVISVSKEKVET